ncbi:MAG: oligosaccharide flippase family protein [Candidatus Helarchaeota archaeon]
MDEKTNENIVSGTFYLFLTQIIIVIISFVNSMFYIPIIGSFYYGYWVSINLIISYILNISNLGLSSALIKFLPSLIIENKKIEIKYYIYIAFSVIIIFNLVLTTLVYILIPQITNFLSFPNDFMIYLGITLIVVPLYVIWANLINVFVAYEKYKWIFIVNLAHQIIFITLALILVFNRLELYSLVIAYISANLIAFLLSLIYYNKSTKVKSLKLESKNEKIKKTRILKSLFKIGGWFYIASLISFVIYNSSLSLVNILLIPSELGYYGLSNSISKIIDYFTVSYQTTLLPIFSKLVSNSNKEKINEIHNNTFKMALFSVFFGLLLIGYSDIIIEFIWGSEFIPSIFPLKILVISFIIWGLTRSISAYSFAMGKTYINSIIGICVIVLNIITGYFLIIDYRLIGAALSTLISYTTGFLIWLLISILVFKIRILSNKNTIKICVYFSILLIVFYITIINYLFSLYFTGICLLSLILIERKNFISIFKLFFNYFFKKN